MSCAFAKLDKLNSVFSFGGSQYKSWLRHNETYSDPETRKLRIELQHRTLPNPINATGQKFPARITAYVVKGYVHF